MQLSTDTEYRMFPLLEARDTTVIDDQAEIRAIYDDPAFHTFAKTNVLPLVYREDVKQCNIMIFDASKARNSTTRIVRLDATSGRGRKHPVWRFEDASGEYIWEVRYGGPDANALQRGLWTNTKRAYRFFRSITGGWIDYSHNLVLVELFAKALNSSVESHIEALHVIESDLERLRLGEK